MAIDIKFDLAGNPEPPTIILANRNGNKLGQLDIDEKSIGLVDKLNDASEFTFTIHKKESDSSKQISNADKNALISSDDYLLSDSDDIYLLSKDANDADLNNYRSNSDSTLWGQITNFKLVYCKEWDTWFEITVELDEETETVKTVFCKQLGQAELSQTMLYDIHVNEEGDPNWDKDNTTYKNTILYDATDSSASLLHRLLEKAPHYSIGHIDDSLKNIQRTFSFDDTSIYDAFQDVAEEIGCLFVFHSNSDEYGMPRRVISVYDLQQNCNDCGYRGEFADVCPNPKCPTNLPLQYPNYQSKGITLGYGEDTTIFVTADELASGGIQLTTDTDSVKNCFKLEAGDDLMNATIRNRNPNGTDYIWYFSDAMKEDMPDEMVNKIESYDELYQYYYNEHISELDTTLVGSYNALVEKYKGYYNSPSTCISCGHEDIFAGNCPKCDSDNVIHGDNLQLISTKIKGFASLMEAYYNTIDLGWYLKSGLMPDVKMGNTDAEEQATLLQFSLPPIIAITNLDIVSKATADSYVLAMAKAVVSSSYKVTISSSELHDADWSGIFIVTNYSDEEDTYTTNKISRKLTDFDETYIKQRIDKTLSKENTDNLSITGLFEKDYDEFCAELKKYALVPLTSFHDACQACIDILIEQGVGNTESVGITENGSEGNLYDKLYKPYYNKLKAIEAEMKVREDELVIILGSFDKDGLQTNIEKVKVDIQNKLNFQNYFGEDLWKQFCAYRREDKYSNSNYISTGLNNAELFERAFEFYQIAENEIFKSSELQHSISATLNNLLAIPKFKSLVKFFKVGNWIRVKIDDLVYKLRLIEYEINYDNFDNISVKFSDVAKIKNGYSDLESVLSNASSMASSYDSIKRQANLGNEAQDRIRQWLDEGLDASLYQIQNNVNEEIVIDNNGLIGRSYSDITEKYSPEQIRLTHNIIAYTDDDWASVKQAIGKHKYKYYDEGKKDFIDAMGYGVSADFVTAGIVSGSQIIGGNIYSDNYSIPKGTGSYINLRDGTFSFGGGALKFNDGKLTISSNPANTNITEINDEWLKTTTVYAQNLNVNAANVTGKLTAAEIDAGQITSGTITGRTINGGELFIGDKNSDAYAEITSKGVLNCKGANITGYINGGQLLIGDKNSDTYAEITPEGVLNCKGANITGEITATSGNIGGCQIVDGVLQIDSANINNLTIDSLGSISFGDLSDWKDVQDDIDSRATNEDLEDLVNGVGITGTFIDGTKIMSPEIYGGQFYATGEGRNGEAAYYIYDSWSKSNGLGNLVGYLSYDTDGSGTSSEAANRVLLTTLDGTALKIQSDGNMSLESGNRIYMMSSVQFADDILLMSGIGFGTQFPNTGTAGQLFFLRG